MRSIHRRRSGPLARRLRRAAVAVALAALVAPLAVTATPASALAQPGALAQADPLPELSPEALAALAGEPQEVTLVTGDRVLLSASGSGGYEVDVEAAPRLSGEPVSFLTQAGPDEVYVLPSDAMPAIQAGTLDRELFNVSYLVEQGLADAETGELPLIVSYQRPVGAAARGYAPDAAELARQADRLPGTSDAVGLASVNGAGVAVSTQDASAFWQRLRGGLESEVASVWLDRTAELVLDESVPLIGAPDAWAAGYDGTGVTVAVLDTGVDLDHPDVVKQVVAAESFVDGGSAQDGHGHGTHVASTIAGTGAASDGRYVGVARGAELVSGKVCDDGGKCPFSSMIAGMEWAAGEMDADVVSMSIGSPPTDGTDPLSEAVNALTASTGALFVVAAGNAGQEQSVGSPGAADTALTVAATDKSDNMARFSSRGPRFGDLALKPDIAAPGVNIVAARAAGTTIGTPVDGWYTALQGTSMATPHVSGVAAILAQRYPEWTPAQLKAALMSTAADAGHTVYEQGAGRVDAGRVASQLVFAATANLDFGISVIPLEGEPEPAPTSREVTYTNLSDQPVTLTLTASLATTGGTPAPAGALVADPSVTVPAGGAATATVTLDPAGLAEASYSGALVAVDAATGVRLTTPVGLVREPQKFLLTVHTIGLDGAPVSPSAQHWLRVDGPGGIIGGVQLIDEGTTAVRVPVGVYSLAQTVDWIDGESRANTALLLHPELTVTGDTEVTLDLREAEQISFETPRPAEPLNNDKAVAYQRTTAGGAGHAGVVEVSSWTRLWATPTEPVGTGGFRFWTQALLGEAQVTLTAPGGPALHAVAPDHGVEEDQANPGGYLLIQGRHPGWIPFTGTQELPLVDVGDGAAEELAGLDLSGKLALVAAGARFETLNGVACGIDIDVLRAIRDAGAEGVVAYPATDHPCGALSVPLGVVQERLTGPAREIGIPNVHVSTQEGLALRERLATGPITLRVEGTPETSYSYVLKPYAEGRVPDSLQFTLTDDQLAEVELDYHADRMTTIQFDRMVYKVDDVVKGPLTMSRLAAPAITGPRVHTEYFGPVAADVVHAAGAPARPGGLAPEGRDHRMLRRFGPVIFDQPAEPRQEWFTVPLSPGGNTAPDAVHQLYGPGARQALGSCTFCRQRGLLYAGFELATGGQDRMQTGGIGSRMEDDPNDFDVRLFQDDGTEIQPLPVGLPITLFQMPPEPGTFQLTGHSRWTDLTWTFHSAEPAVDSRQPGYWCFPESWLGQPGPCAPEPIVFASYDLADSLATDNTVRAPGAHRFSVYAYHSPSPVPMPAIAGLKLWVSYDGGEQWASPLRVQDRGDGQFDITVIHPPNRHRASDQVSLKIEVWDEAGNRLEQVTRDAFTLD